MALLPIESKVVCTLPEPGVPDIPTQSRVYCGRLFVLKGVIVCMFCLVVLFFFQISVHAPKTTKIDDWTCSSNRFRRYTASSIATWSMWGHKKDQSYRIETREINWCGSRCELRQLMSCRRGCLTELDTHQDWQIQCKSGLSHGLLSTLAFHIAMPFCLGVYHGSIKKHCIMAEATRV